MPLAVCDKLRAAVDAEALRMEQINEKFAAETIKRACFFSLSLLLLLLLGRGAGPLR